MSGPIIRKYGFPNFEKIFGERDLKHGAEDPSATPGSPQSPTEATKPVTESEPTKPADGSTK